MAERSRRGSTSQGRPRLRAAVCTLAGLALAAVTFALASSVLTAARTDSWGTMRSPAEPLAWVCEVALVLVLTRLTLCCLACALALAWSPRTPRGLAIALTPRALRPWVVAAVLSGVGLAGVGPAAAATAGPALAQPRTPAAATVAATAITTDPRPLPDAGWAAAGALPDAGWRASAPTGARHRPAHLELLAPHPRRASQPGTTQAGTTRAGTTQAGTPEAASVVVRRGDCLWTLAARHLGPGATDAQIAAEWPRWWAANRAVVGADPNRLHPGDVLQAPQRSIR